MLRRNHWKEDFAVWDRVALKTVRTAALRTLRTFERAPVPIIVIGGAQYAPCAIGDESFHNQ